MATEPFMPEQRLDLAAALAGYTIGSAQMNPLDHGTGPIEVGKLADLADLAVFDRDSLKAPADEIGQP